MNKLYFSFILILFYTVLHAQFEHATWYFGKKAGVDFSSGSPIGITDGQIDTGEGCASISDDCGNLLFYTDGGRVYNRNHTVMQNGYGLAGNSTSTQSAIIVPNPANADQYYIFTIYSVSGFYYSIVDMTLDGGNGGLITGQKNIQIPILQGYYKASEKVTFALTAECNGFWIITHAVDKFYSFKLTEEGLNMTPIITTIGINVPLEAGASSIGYLKVSTDSKKLAIAHKRVTQVTTAEHGALAIYDFDNATGIVSNEKVLYAPDLTAQPRSYYGVEFSPNGNILYATTENSFLYQYDLTSSNIPSTEKIISGGLIGALQLGIDRKIYLNPFESYYLSVINNPDELLDPIAGTNPDFVSNAVFLEGKSTRFGVPSFTIPYTYKGKIEINSVDNQCEGENCFQVPLNFEFIGCPDASLVWDFGDGNTSTAQNPIHTYAAIGTYTILLTYTLQGHTYTTTTEITIHPLPSASNAELEECLDFEGNAEFDLTQAYLQIDPSGSYDITFHELESEAATGDNDLPTTYPTSTTTTIWVRIENEFGCFVVRELALIVNPVPTFTVEFPEVEICTGSSAELEITTDATNTINWYDSQNGTTPIYTGNPFTTANLTLTTTYWVEVVSDEGCPSERREILVVVSDEITPQFDQIEPICFGDNFTLPDESINQITGTWTPAVDNTQTTTYTFQPDAGQCSAENVTMTVEVVPIPEITLPDPIEICFGETVTITVATTGETLNWYESEFSIDPIHTGTIFSEELTATTTYWLEAQTGNCKSERIPFTVTVNPLPTIEAGGSNPVCEGNSAELSVMTNGQTVNWYDSENAAMPIFTGNPFITPNLNQTTTYWAEAISSENCTSERIAITATVSEEITPTFDVQDEYCLNSPEIILPTNSENGVSGIWSPAIIDTNNLGTEIYTFTPDLECAQTIQIPVTIVEIIISEFNDLIQNYCLNSTADSLPVQSDNGISGTWFPSEINTNIQGTTTYKFTPDEGQCSEEYLHTVTVYPHPDMDLEEELLICEGDSFTYSAPDGFDSYEWTNEQDQVISSTREVTFTEEGIYTLTVEINGIPCDLSRSIEVSFSTPPTITEIKTTENSITIYATGGHPLEYSMNEVFWQSSPTFTNLQPGIFNVFVRDAKGCSTTAKQAGILGVPNFISPNGDGYNDTWEIRALEVYPNTRLQIFDRYGKIFVDRILSTDFSWDGKYNGQPLPSASYWYILILENGERISGNINIRNY